MNFLIPCDDIITDIADKHDSLCLNPCLVFIGYQETQWVNNASITECKFQQFESLLSNDENITIDNIVYIKYIDIYLWHKLKEIDRMNGSGKTNKAETWHKIKNKYTQHLNLTHDQSSGDDEKQDNKPKGHSVELNIDRDPAPLMGEKQNGYRRRYNYYYYWHNPAEDIINNGYYEVNDKNNNGKSMKIKIEKYLKKSYKKTKLYSAHKSFKYLTPNQLDTIYRNYEKMEINIINCSSLKGLYTIHQQKSFKKVCVINVYGVNNGFERNSTINHSLSKYSYDISTNESDEASSYLYTNTMVYSPNCIIFNDLNGKYSSDYLKVSFLTVYAVNANEYYRMKRKIFDEPKMEERLKKLNDKLNQNGQKLSKKGKAHKHHHHHHNNKNDKRTELETEEYILKLQEMRDVINNIMKERIRRMIEIAIYNGCDSIIFDAFGCDAQFGNDVRQIADIFTTFMKTIYFNCFKSVTFCILDEEFKRNNNHKSSKSKRNKKEDKDIISTFKIFQESFQSKFS